MNLEETLIATNTYAYFAFTKVIPGVNALFIGTIAMPKLVRIFLLIFGSKVRSVEEHNLRMDIGQYSILHLN
jgi:hypothetical protein